MLFESSFRDVTSFAVEREVSSSSVLIRDISGLSLQKR